MRRLVLCNELLHLRAKEKQKNSLNYDTIYGTSNTYYMSAQVQTSSMQLSFRRPKKKEFKKKH